VSDSTALDTIAALVAVCSAGMPNVYVVDGPAAVKTAALDRLFIGTSDDGTGISAEGDNPEGMLPGVIDSETFGILCLAESVTGGNDMSPVRVRAWATRTAVRALLRPSPQQIVLGVPALASARLGPWALTQVQDSQGAYARVVFRIECIARPSTT